MSNRARLAIDVGLFVAFLVAFAPTLTGITVHEWLSLALIVPALVHLVVNWDWVMRVAVRLFGKIRAASAANLVIDAVLFVATVAVMLSGFMLSQVIASALGLATTPTVAWHVVHVWSANAVIVMMLVHLAMHGRWFARVVDDLFGVPHTTQATPAAPRVFTPKEARDAGFGGER